MIQLSICDVIVIVKKVLLEKQTHILWVGLNLSHRALSYDIAVLHKNEKVTFYLLGEK